VRRQMVLMLLSGLSFASMAHAQPVGGVIGGCVKALNACALDRAGQLAAASDKLATASRGAPAPTASAADKAKAQEFTNWLKNSSGQLRTLADRGKSATDEANQKAFVEQAAQMQRDMQRQMEAFQALSNVMKAQHDMAKQAIQNIRN
jgi:hypothetical protein